MTNESEGLEKMLEDTEDDFKLLNSDIQTMQNQLDQLNGNISVMTNKRNILNIEINKLIARVDTVMGFRNRMYEIKGETPPPLRPQQIPTVVQPSTPKQAIDIDKTLEEIRGQQ